MAHDQEHSNEQLRMQTTHLKSLSMSLYLETWKTKKNLKKLQFTTERVNLLLLLSGESSYIYKITHLVLIFLIIIFKRNSSFFASSCCAYTSQVIS